MTHAVRWTIEKITQRLALIEPLVHRRRVPLPSFRYLALPDPATPPALDVDAANWLIIEEATDYPFSDTITFTIKPDCPIKFALWLRRPGWATTFDLTVTDGSISEIEGWITVEKLWSKNEVVTLQFSAAVDMVPYANGEYGVRYGPLQYVLPIAPELQAIKDYAVAGFHDYDITPKEPTQAVELP